MFVESCLWRDTQQRYPGTGMIDVRKYYYGFGLVERSFGRIFPEILHEAYDQLRGEQ